MRKRSLLLRILNNWWNSGDVIPPTLSNFIISDVNKSRIYFDSSEPITGTTFANFTVASPSRTISAVSIAAGLLTGHFFTVTVAFAFGDAPTIAYAGGDNFKDIAKIPNNLKAFTAVAITNNIQASPDVTPPTLSTFVIQNANPNRIAFTSSEPITGTTFAQFTVALPTNAITAVTIVPGQTTGHYFTVTSNFSFGDVPTLAYAGGDDFKDIANNNLASFAATAITNNVDDRQSLWDAIASTAHYGNSVFPVTGGGGGAYKETAITNLCASGDECMGLKAFGSSKPTPSNLLFAGSTALHPDNALVIWKDFGNVNNLAPLYINDGGWDRYLRFWNGPPNIQYLESNPGAFTVKVQPVDMYMLVRWIPQINDEGFGGIKVLTNNTEKLSFIDSYTPDITLANGSAYNHYTDSLLRVQVKADNTWQVWINGVSKGTGSGVAFSTTEEWWGTNSHVLGLHVRFRMWVYGAFSAGDVATIEANAQRIWPWTAKPTYPLLTELYYGDATTWDGSAKSWRMGRGKTVVFSGGNGVEGTHKFMWYYFEGGDATLFPSADGILTNIRQVPSSAFINTMASGNSLTQVSIDGTNLMSAPVTWTTDLATTAAAIVSNINAFQSGFLAVYKGTGTIQFHPKGVGCNAYHTNAVTVTGSGFTPTKLDAPRSQDLVRTTYAVNGQIWFGKEGTNAISVMGVCFPFDSAGTAGTPLISRDIKDNIV